MPNWLSCMLTGRHQYSVWCEDGAMFLRCSNCGRRSQGWQVASRPAASEREVAKRREAPAPTTAVSRLSIVNGD